MGCEITQDMLDVRDSFLALCERCCTPSAQACKDLPDLGGCDALKYFAHIHNVVTDLVAGDDVPGDCGVFTADDDAPAPVDLATVQCIPEDWLIDEKAWHDGITCSGGGAATCEGCDWQVQYTVTIAGLTDPSAPTAGVLTSLNGTHTVTFNPGRDSSGCLWDFDAGLDPVHGLWPMRVALWYEQPGAAGVQTVVIAEAVGGGISLSTRMIGTLTECVVVGAYGPTSGATAVVS